MADFEDRKQNQGGGSHPAWQKRQGQQNQNQQQGGRQKQPQTDRDRMEQDPHRQKRPA